MWMVLYVCLKKLALSVNCYLILPYLIIFEILVWGQVVLSLDVTYQIPDGILSVLLVLTNS